MADSDFQVFELSRKLQLRLKFQGLLSLLSGGFFILARIMLKWRVPCGRVITRGTVIVGLKSAVRKEEFEEIGWGTKRWRERV